MEEVQYLEIIKTLNELKELINTLTKEINDNEQLLIDLLKANNMHTKKIYDVTVGDKSTEQQAKDFLLNIAANIAGNAVSVPQIISLR